MGQRDRLEQIRQIIRRDKRVVVTALSVMLDVTPETIRRDLEKLEKEGLLTRNYGGAVLRENTRQEKISYLLREQTNVQDKRIIADLAARFITPGASIGCDASSTCMELLREIRDRSDVLVLTNSVKAIFEMTDTKFNILSTGGYVNRQSYSMQSSSAKSRMQDYHMDYVFISCKGLSWDGGIYDSHEAEIEMKKNLIEQGNRVYLLVDHTKFDTTAFSKLSNLEEIDGVVTDCRPSEQWMELFENNNVDVYFPQDNE